ncbi:MAG: hypothetical protein AB1603_07375 [Chloroflexota bacterium]
MSKLRLVFVLSLVLLAFLLVWVGRLSYAQLGGESDSSVASSGRHLELDGGGVVLSYTTRNETGRALEYSYYFYEDGELVLGETRVVEAGSSFAFTANVDPEEGGLEKLRLVVYRQGESEPLVDETRYVKELVRSP